MVPCVRKQSIFSPDEDAFSVAVWSLQYMEVPWTIIFLSLHFSWRLWSNSYSTACFYGVIHAVHFHRLYLSLAGHNQLF